MNDRVCELSDHADGMCWNQHCALFVCSRCRPEIRLRCVSCASASKTVRRTTGVMCHCRECGGSGVPIDVAMERVKNVPPGPKIHFDPTPGAATKEQPVCQFCREDDHSHCVRYLPTARSIYVPGEVACQCGSSFHQGGWYP